MVLKKIAFTIGEKGYKLLYNFFNLFISKRDKVLVISNVKIEDNAVAMANYLADHSSLEIGMMLPENQFENIRPFLNPDIKLYKSPRHMPLDWASFKTVASHRYVFLTYQFLYGNWGKRQVFTNLWHGLAYKKIQSARAYDGIRVKADYTISGSQMTQKMNAQLFDVSMKSVLISGLPRNDIMLRVNETNNLSKVKVELDFNEYSKIIIWMPTYRRSKNTVEIVGKNNMLGVEDFDVSQFNEVLKKNDTLCLVKTHHMLEGNKNAKEYSHILPINDNWLNCREILLYQLLACTDALISDYSSVIMDYTLLDKPIFCIAKDLEAYKKYQGLCFEDYENWVPSELFKDSDAFLKAIEEFLSGGKDAYTRKRHRIRKRFFKYSDDKSAQRIAEQVLPKRFLKG